MKDQHWNNETLVKGERGKWMGIPASITWTLSSGSRDTGVLAEQCRKLFRKRERRYMARQHLLEVLKSCVGIATPRPGHLEMGLSPLSLSVTCCHLSLDSQAR